MYDKLIFQCPYECEQEIRFEKLESHVSEECPKRLIMCPRPCCGEILTLDEIEEHGEVCDGCQ